MNILEETSEHIIVQLTRKEAEVLKDAVAMLDPMDEEGEHEGEAWDICRAIETDLQTYLDANMAPT